MTRSIIDKVVVGRCEASGIDADMLREIIPIGLVYVKEDLDKVRLNKSDFGISPERLLGSLKMKYDSININGDDCFIEINGIHRNVSKNTLRMIKALGLEQVSSSSIYSKAVAHCFMQLIKQALGNNVTCEFLPQDTTDLSIYHINIIKVIEGYAKTVLLK